MKARVTRMLMCLKHGMLWSLEMLNAKKNLQAHVMIMSIEHLYVWEYNLKGYC